MATEQRKATVIIAGSGLTGLTLALMLQDLGVDYLLLEAYDSCTPNVGASIAIQPQGMRVLHQLGVHEDIEALFQPVWRAYAVDADTYVFVPCLSPRCSFFFASFFVSKKKEEKKEKSLIRD